MSFAGGLIKHLGLQMYSGPVPSIAELVANAWDAMANEVRISLPTNRQFTAADQIVVEDSGHGMTYGETNKKYLVVGRDRRTEEGDLSQKFGKIPRRRVMSRKGIGKLAGFGIARVVEVRTVKDGKITHFEMDFDEMTKDAYVKKYRPKILLENGKTTTDKPGTRIVLKKLKVSKTVDAKEFALSMARRFTILSDPNFAVFLNGEKVKKEELPFQFRYPKKKGTWNTEKVPGAGTIKWWVGFTEKPIADEEARGIVVFARRKLAQAPWFFGMSGGTFGQHGMQYMTGEVQAEFLDVTGGDDLIATPRNSVLWDETKSAVALKEWGFLKVKELLKKWAEERVREKRARPEIKKYLAYGERLPEREKQIFNSYIEKITSIPQIDKDEEILDELAKFGYNALTNQHFLEMIKQINAASPDDTAKIGKILSEWDIIEAVNAAQQVKGRVEIIRKFGEMVDGGVPEKPDMQEYIKQHPWLIDPAWAPLEHEKRLDTLLNKRFQVTKTGAKAGKKRPDYFSLAAANQCQIVDLKRPQIKVGMKELQQIQEYVMFMREETKKTNHPDLKINHVGGILIYSDIDTGSGIGTMIDSLEKEAIHVIRWDDLLRRTETLHKEFLNVIKGRAPADDPRITGLDQINGKTPSAKSKKIAKGRRKKR